MKSNSEIDTLIETPKEDPILQHVAGYFGKSVITCHRWPMPPARPVPEGWNRFFIIELKKSRQLFECTGHDGPLYITSGAWRLTSTHPRLEFLLCAPKSDPCHVGTMTALSFFQHDPDFPPDVGHLLPIGKPWLPGSTCDRLLLSLPYPFGPKLEWTGVGDVCIRLLWAVPVTPAEAQLAREQSAEKLEQRFEKAKIAYGDFLDPNRASVV